MPDINAYKAHEKLMKDPETKQQYLQEQNKKKKKRSKNVTVSNKSNNNKFYGYTNIKKY